MSAHSTLSRREFLQRGALAGGLVIAFRLAPRGFAAGPAPADPAAAFAPNAFLRIAPDGAVTILAKHSEMGQGIYTSIAMCVADELDADWSRISVAAAPAEPAYHHTALGMQITGGSSSTMESTQQMRQAGATARAMLVEAAARRWKLAPAALRTENGDVLAPDGRTATYGSLADEAAKLSPPAEVKLKDSAQLKLIGRPMRRLDARDKVTGRAVFGLDLRVPGMLTAVLARPPVFGGKLQSFDAVRVRAVPGVKHVVAVPAGVAVVAENFWAAKLGRDALQIAWDETSGSVFDSDRQSQEYAALLRQPGAVARHDGDAAAAIAGAATKITATFDFPYLAHAAMEPLNAIAHVKDDGTVEVWAPTQFQTADQKNAARIAGVAPEKVTVHTTLLGSAFGRKGNPASDFVVEAVMVSKVIGAPVQVVWTREDDMRGGYYRPRTHVTTEIGLDAAGTLVGWESQVASQSILKGTLFEQYMGNGVDGTQVEGLAELPYAVPNVRVEWHIAPAAVPVLWWRSVGHSYSAFVVETLIDDAARAAGRDPLDYRTGLLAARPRHVAVLHLLREKSAWGNPPRGRFQGVAIHESYGTTVGEVAEISVAKDGTITVHRVTAVVDCGSIVNPETIRAQIMSGVIFGLSAALNGQITFKAGRPEQSNYHDYPVARMDNAPVVETHIIASQEKMGGIGEPGTPPIAPAVANALFAATGKRVRSLPLTPDKIV